MSKTIFPRLNKSLEHQIEKTMANTPLNIKKQFKLALTPHKFETEVYIPKNLKLNKTEYAKKNYFINKIISFDTLYKPEKERRLRIKKETDVFSQQYKPINDDKFNKKDNYVKKVEENYKIKGYDMNDLSYSRKDNIFAPSILFKDSDHDLRLTCKIEPSRNIIRDNNYLSRVEDSITNIKKNKSGHIEEEEEKKRFRPKRFSILSDDYINAIINVRNKIKEEIQWNKMSLKQMKKLNRNLRKEIKQINLSLNDANEENKKMKEKRNNENAFLISNRLNKDKKKNNDTHLNINGKEDDKIMIIDNNRKFKRNEKKNKDLSNTELMRKEVFEKKKNERLETVYNEILRTNFILSEKDAENYINLYTNRKVPYTDYKTGSNLHGIFQEFQKRSREIDLPEKAKLINHTKRDIYNQTYSGNIDYEGKAYDLLQRNLYDVEQLNEEENKINNLPFDYSYDILNGQ